MSSIPSDLSTNERAALEIISDSTDRSDRLSRLSEFEMSSVELFVTNLEKEMEFYKEGVGLELLSQSNSSVELGIAKNIIVRLIKKSSLPPFPRTSAGLYHLAIVFESRATLAETIQRIITLKPYLFEGTADHLVSEAFYFSDPEGNGVELYFDKNPSSWKWQDGKIVMDSIYIDPQSYINKNIRLEKSIAKRLGHIHLQVGNIDQAKAFYVDTLGFTVTAEFPSALFISDGVYHHHIGMNTWHSEGAGKRTETLGLSQFEVHFNDRNKYLELLNRINNQNLSISQSNNGFVIEDPWRNKLIFSS